MMSSASSSAPDPLALQHNELNAVALPAPNLLVQWTPRRREFFGNMFDLLLMRRVPNVKITARPARFWGDVFVPDPFPKRGVIDSLLVHIFVVVAAYGLTVTYVRPPVQLRDSFAGRHLAYYAVDDVLPEVNTDSASDPSEQPKKALTSTEDKEADPVYARQEIISVPPDPDNIRQTIVTPNNVKLSHDIPLPNMVAAMPELAQPVEVAQNNPPPTDDAAPKLTYRPELPLFDNATAIPQLAPQPLLVQQGPSMKLPWDNVAAPKLAVAPGMPDVATATRMPQLAPQPMAVRQGAAMRRSPQPDVAAPNIPTGSNVAAGAVGSLAANGSRLPRLQPRVETQSRAVGAALPEAPRTGPMLALSTTPVAPNGPIVIPEGNRRGAFAAGPTGRPNATGAPATTTIPAGRNGAASGTGPGQSTSALPPGISVAGDPNTAPKSGVVVAAPAPTPPAANPNVRERLMAAARPSGDLPPVRVSPTPEPDLEKKVFAGKRYYTLTLNMPNLSSASGSWIIRFAELNPGPDKSELAAPIALAKSDPAYPPDLMKDKIEGTVVLYAVIRADGSITDVRVLNSVEERLDANAMRALNKWRFQPGSKHGTAVDIEAVVQIPFRVRKLAF